MKFLHIAFSVLGALSLMGANCCNKKETPAVIGAPAHQKQSEDDALKRKKHKAECEKDSDCVAIKVDCCDCNQGGKRRAVTKAAREIDNERLLINCDDVVCLQMVSEDPSCTQKAACRSGHCVLE